MLYFCDHFRQGHDRDFSVAGWERRSLIAVIGFLGNVELGIGISIGPKKAKGIPRFGTLARSVI
jgi:hypothetical protein